jgi:hypothetical protein
MYAVIVGVLLGFSAARFRSLSYAVAGHIAFNAFTILAGNLLPDTEVSSPLLLVIGLVAFAACLFGILKREHPAEPEIAPPEETAAE